MQKQDKATTERHARILREMVKRPENKVCADCKRNDPRWASWNIGVFVCIRCSGIHRSMGTHISKVKSVDLDTWSVEQIQSMQKWGNHRANLYWEAHLRQGHVPPEHKIDSFVRSKYELRRWALEGAPPSDPSTLENGTTELPAVLATEAQLAPAPPQSHNSSSHSSHRQRHVLHSLTSGSSQQGIVTEQPIASLAVSTPPATSTPTPTVMAAPMKPVEDLFSLDFHSPPTSTQTQTSLSPGDNLTHNKSAKDNIMSLFGSPQPQTQASMSLFAAQAKPVPAGGALASNASSLWGAPQSAAPLAGSIAQASPANAWNTQAQRQTTWAPSGSYPTAQSNVWGSGGGNAAFSSSESGIGMGAKSSTGPIGTTTQTNVNAVAMVNSAGIFNSSDVWGTPAGSSQKMDLFSKPATTTAKDDAFGDIWGGFK